MTGAELVGRWSLDRVVTDRLAGRTGTVRGSLEIRPEQDRIGWYETGLLTWGSWVTPVGRVSYLTTVDGAPWMTFADGRPFHPWRPGHDVVHPCGDDRYDGRVDVGDGVITTVWRVTGPAKDQLLRTELRRV